MQYLSRSIDPLLKTALTAMGGVLLEGARACGKTSTGLHHAGSSVRLDQHPDLVELAGLAPERLLRGKPPRLIDEWQLAPSLWNVIRHEIDDRQARGQFIISGSATPADDVTRHTGVGRIARIRMRPMSLAESGSSSSDISFADVMGGLKKVSATSPLSYREYAELAVRGGWPGLLGGTVAAIQLFCRSYIDDLTTSDIPEATGVRHDAVQMRRLLMALARNVATEVTLRTLADDVGADGSSIEPKTIGAYRDALTRVFALEELPAWSASLRSRSRLRTGAVTHFVDPSLACAALGINAQRLADNPEYFGQVFESMVLRDVRAYASAAGGLTYRYRDNTNLEVDIIVEYPDASWAAFEVKLGSTRIPQAEANLLKLRDERIDLSIVGQPAALAIITATPYAYTLSSGVHVIPLGCLCA